MNTKNKHGLSSKKLYSVWKAIKQRCYNSKNQDYCNYGLRGIKMCEEWKNDYIKFHKWSIKNEYVEGLSLDRIDVNGNYEPNNCRWVTNKQQANNKRNTIYIEYDDERITISELSEKTGIKREVIEMRYIRGDRGERLYRRVRKKAS